MTSSNELLADFAVQLDELQASFNPHPLALQDSTAFAHQMKAQIKALVDEIYTHTGEPKWLHQANATVDTAHQK